MNLDTVRAAAMAAGAAAPTVSIFWALIAVWIARGQNPLRKRGWSLYFLAQAALTLMGVMAMAIRVFGDPSRSLGGLIHEPAQWLMRLTLINTIVAAAAIEATYRGIPGPSRSGVRPWILALGVLSLLGVGWIAVELARGPIKITSLRISLPTLACLCLLIPLAFVAKRRAPAQIQTAHAPMHHTLSLIAGIVVFVGQETVVLLSRITGWRTVPQASVVMAGFLVAGLVAVAVSNRVRRRLRWAIVDLLYDGWLIHPEPHPALAAVAERARCKEELFRQLPALTREIVGVEPVTLFVLGPGGEEYVAIASTMTTMPPEPVASDEPLARLLAGTRRTAMLSSRGDDLENAPVYAVNGRQILGCHALSATPLHDGRTMYGFMLCGSAIGGGRHSLDIMGRLEGLGRQVTASLGRVPEPGEVAT